MTRLDPRRIEAEFDAWRWVPPDAEVVETPELHLYAIRGAAHVARPPSSGTSAGRLDALRSAARSLGAATLSWTLSDPLPADLAHALGRADARLADTSIRFVLDLVLDLPAMPVPDHVDARPIRTRREVRDGLDAGHAVWGGAEVTDEAVDQRYAEADEGWFVINARSATSAPIIERIGFTRTGSTSTYEIPVREAPA